MDLCKFSKPPHITIQNWHTQGIFENFLSLYTPQCDTHTQQLTGEYSFERNTNWENISQCAGPALQSLTFQNFLLCVVYESQSSLLRGLCIVLWCWFSNCIGEIDYFWKILILAVKLLKGRGVKKPHITGTRVRTKMREDGMTDFRLEILLYISTTYKFLVCR